MGITERHSNNYLRNCLLFTFLKGNSQLQKVFLLMAYPEGPPKIMDFKKKLSQLLKSFVSYSIFII